MFTPMTSPELMLKLHTVREREALTKAASEQLVAHVHSRKLHGGYGFFVGAGANLIVCCPAANRDKGRPKSGSCRLTEIDGQTVGPAATLRTA